MPNDMINEAEFEIILAAADSSQVETIDRKKSQTA